MQKSIRSIVLQIWDGAPSKFLRKGFCGRKRKILWALATTVILYQVMLYPGVVHKAIDLAVRHYAPGSTLALKVTRSSLLFGFDFRNVALKNARTGKPLFTVKRINLSFFLPSFLIGHIGIRELGLYEPRIYLENEDGVWNYANMFRASQPSAIENPKSSGPMPSVINTYLPLKFYAGLIIKDFGISYRTKNKRRTTHLRLSNADFRFAAITRTFNEIPLDSRILDLFDTLIMGINPVRPMRLDYEGRSRVHGDLRFTWLLYRNEGQNGSEFVSRLRFDTKRLIAGRGRFLLPLDFVLGYNTIFDRRRDRLLVRDLKLSQGNVPWFELAADISNLTRDDRKISLKITRSRIRLGVLRRKLAIFFPGMLPAMGGDLSLAPFEISGHPEHLVAKGIISGSGLFFGSREDGTPAHHVKRMRLKVSAELDAYRLFPFLKRPRNYKTETRLAYNIFHKARITDLRADYNGGSLRLNATLNRRGRLKARLKASALNLDLLAGAYIGGRADADISFQSNEKFSQMQIDGFITSADFQYAIGRSRSATQNVFLELVAKIRTGSGKTIISIPDIQLESLDMRGREALSLEGSVRMAFGGGSSFLIRINGLETRYDRLEKLLPGSLRSSLKPVAFALQRHSVQTVRPGTILENSPDQEGLAELSGFLKLRLDRGSTGLETDLQIILPFYDYGAVNLKTAVSIAKRKILIRNFRLQALNGDLLAEARGKLSRRKITDNWEPDMKASLRIRRAKLWEAYPGLSLRGELNVGANLSPQKIKGKLSIVKLNAEYRLSDCRRAAKEKCISMRVEQANLSLPFAHDLKMRRADSDASASALQWFGLGFRDEQKKPNFTIRFIASTHKPRGEYIKDGAFFVAGGPTGVEGIRAHISYERNILRIKNLAIESYKPLLNAGGRIKWRQNGGIYSKQAYLNLADLSRKNMTYGVFLQMKNLDLEPFLPASRSGYDGIISGDLNLVGHSMLAPLYNTDAWLSVYRISPEFGGFLTRIIMPGRIAEGIVQSAFSIPAVKLQLKEGLVYSTVILKGNILVRPSAEEITRERIPLAQFLASAGAQARD